MKLRTIGSSPVLGVLLLSLAISVIWAANAPIDDPYSIQNTQWNGTSSLAQIGFLPVTSALPSALTNPPRVLLMVAPSSTFSREEATSIEESVKDGSLLVIADNFGTGNRLLTLLGLPVKFDNRRIVDPLFYRKEPSFPVISRFSDSEFTHGLDELVLDLPTRVNITDASKVKVLASSSAFSFLDVDQDGEKGQQEPSGPFPILAELQMGDGKILLFTSPGSFGNGLIGEGSNNILIQDIAGYGSSHGGYAKLLYDETHLGHSPFTPPRLFAQQLVTSILEGGMSLSLKLELSAACAVMLVARYAYRKPSKVQTKSKELYAVHSPSVETVLRVHPTWDRKKLEYVARELDASMRWRQVDERE